MFGLRSLKKIEYADGLAPYNALDAPYSRYEGIEQAPPPASKFSRYLSEVKTAAPSPKPAAVPAQEAPRAAPLQHNVIDPAADLHSDAPIPVSLLRRALPLRFAGMQRHAIRSRASLAEMEVDEIEFVFG